MNYRCPYCGETRAEPFSHCGESSAHNIETVMSKHTLGVWEVTHDRGHVAVVCGHRVMAYTGMVGAPDEDESRANAKLIAAAPDLLGALKWLVDLMPDPELDTDDVQRQEVIKAKAAIAKATGSAL